MATTNKGTRFLFVDGLRGIAALMVVVYHLREAVSSVSSNWIWPALDAMLGYGYLGVDVFFAISGFVISFSVRNYRHTAGFLFRFGLRRSVRLDPPYWLTIVLELVAIQVGLHLFPSLGTAFPSREKIAAHFAYLQDFLGYGNIIAIFWTLCYEVQFYLVFVGMLVLATQAGNHFGSRPKRLFVIASASIAFSWSILIFFGPLRGINGLFIDRWFQFFLGVLAMECVTSGRLSLQFLVCWLSVVAGVFLGPKHAPIGYATTLVTGLLVLAGLRGRIATWLSGAPFQFLGRISYSLYLLHAVVGWRFVKLLRVWNGSDFSTWQAWGTFLLGCGVSVLSAWLMYSLVERPALRLCHRIAMDRSLHLWPKVLTAIRQGTGRSQ